MEHILSLASDYDVKHVISAGDLLDSDDPDSYTVTALRNFIETLDHKRIQFNFIEGNHDKQPIPWPHAAYKEVRHLHELLVTMGNIRVVGLDFQPPSNLEESVAKLPEANLYMVHQSWAGLEAGGSPDGSATWFPAGSTVFSGDLHRNVHLQVINGPLLVSPGATHLRHIDEPLEHYCYLLTKSGKLVRKLLRGRLIRREVLETDAALERLLDSARTIMFDFESAYSNDEWSMIPQRVRRPLLIVRYATSMNRVKSQIAKAFGDQMHLIVKPMPEQSFARDIDDDPVVARSSLVEYVEGRLPKSDPRYDSIVSLITATDKEAAIASLREKYDL